MIKTLKFYVKMACKFVNKDIITDDDYRQEYDKIAKTYPSWLEEMGKYTDKIIKSEFISKQEKTKVLDLACGTGYITKKLLIENGDLDITAVDISANMLRGFDEKIKSNIHIINSDGIEFLRNTSDRYDTIYCGWALPYFNHNELLRLVKDRLNPNGIFAVISNSKGTLEGIENIYLNVMKENQNQIVKPMDIRFNLPGGKTELKKWFKKHGFLPLQIEEEEAVFAFDSAKELHDWIVKTGAVAGTGRIFSDYNAVEEDVIRKIEKEKFRDGKYTINHKFVCGIFRRT